MKTAKKFLSLLLAAMMLLSLSSVSAFADELPTEGTITVSNAVTGQTYTVYKLLDLMDYVKEDNSYSYKVAEKWEGFFAAEGASYIKVGTTGFVEAASGLDATTASDFAKLALAYAKANSIAPDATPVKKNADGDVVSFTELDLGYYLVETSLGTLCALTTTDPTKEINEKNGVPTLEKEIKQNPGPNWGDWNDATIGDTIYYNITVVGQPGAKAYVIHDKMDAGLTMNYDSIVINVRDEAIDASNYEVVTAADTDDECTFEIRFTQAFCDKITKGELIVVTYNAVLNDNAVVCPATNDNTARLEYGDKNYTAWDTVKTYTHNLQIVKTTNDANGKKVLQGAKFKLYYASNDKEIKLYEVSEGIYRPITDAAAQTETEIVAGAPVIQGLDAGTYYVIETAAPKGYNPLAGKSLFTLGDETEVEGGSVLPTHAEQPTAVLSADGSEWVSGGFRIINQTGTEMPETGATGTILFITVGAFLALAGYIFLVSKKRMDAEIDG